MRTILVNVFTYEELDLLAKNRAIEGWKKKHESEAEREDVENLLVYYKLEYLRDGTQWMYYNE